MYGRGYPKHPMALGNLPINLKLKCDQICNSEFGHTRRPASLPHIPNFL